MSEPRSAPRLFSSQKTGNVFVEKSVTHAPLLTPTLGVIRGDEPDCPGKSNLLTALIGLQRAPDRRGNRGTGFRNPVLQREACGSECHRGIEGLFDPASTGDVESEVERLKHNRLKSGVRKNAVHALFAGKGEGAWIFGPRSRQRRKMFAAALAAMDFH